MTIVLLAQIVHFLLMKGAEVCQKMFLFLITVLPTMPHEPPISSPMRDGAVDITWSPGEPDDVTYVLEEMKGAFKTWAVIGDDLKERTFHVTGLKPEEDSLYR